MKLDKAIETLTSYLTYTERMVDFYAQHARSSTRWIDRERTQLSIEETIATADSYKAAIKVLEEAQSRLKVVK